VLPLTIWPKSFVDLVHPSDFASNPVLHHARHHYAHEEITLVLPLNPSSHRSVDVRLFDDEPPMARLPYPPPTHEFQRYSPPVPTHTPSPYTPHTPDFLATSHLDESEVPMAVPSQSYMSIEVESSTPSFIHANQQHYHSQRKSPSYTHCESSGSLHHRSASPRGALRISPPPHKK